MKKIFALIVVLSIAVMCSACGKELDPTGISLEEFEKINTGMERSDVFEIIGGEGVRISEKEIETNDYIDYISVYKFDGEKDGYAEIEFTKRASKDILEMDFSDFKVTSKTQYDLS